MDHLSWLPPRYRGKVRCVVSANSEHYITMSRLYDHRPLHMKLSYIDVPSRHTMVSNFFENFNKVPTDVLLVLLI